MDLNSLPWSSQELGQNRLFNNRHLPAGGQRTPGLPDGLVAGSTICEYFQFGYLRILIKALTRPVSACFTS
jgi:hypothetical protein